MKSNEKIQVLFVDDEVDTFIKSWQLGFKDEFDFITESSLTTKAVMKQLDKHKDVTVVILDLLDSGGKRVGIDILKAIPKDRVQVIVLSILGDLAEIRDQCDRAGAYDYFSKESDREAVAFQIRSAHLNAKYGIYGRSSEIQRVIDRMERVAEFNVSVLITGETGVGKERVARGLHENSERKGGFFPQNIAAISGDLLHSELFGHEKGAFTGADKQRDGLFFTAGKSGGIAFLDEIGDAPPDVQLALLRVLQERKVKPLGSELEKPEGEEQLDFRLICATNQRLEAQIEEKQFRPDLYYRIAQEVIEVPPLRKRKEDIGILAHQFIAKYRKEFGDKLPKVEQIEIDPTDMRLMKNHDWAGNVRELETIVIRGLIWNRLKDGIFKLDEYDRAKMETRSSLSSPPSSPAAQASIPLIDNGDFLSMENIQKQAVQLALEHTKGNITQPAKLLNMDRQAYRRWIKKYEIIFDR